MWNFKTFSRLLTLLAVLFLILMLWRADLWALLPLLGPKTLLHLGWAALALTLGWFPLAWIWGRQVDRLSAPSPLPLKVHFTIFATTQIQKYVPGNVFHYLLRHMETRRRGESDIGLFWAWVAELLGQTIAALVLAFISLGWLLTRTDHALLFLLFLATLVAILVGLRLLERMMPKIVRFLSKKVGRDPTPLLDELDRPGAGITPKLLATGFPAYLSYIALTGLVACGLAATLIPLELSQIPYILGWTGLSWFIGFALPGAPGGIGPREATLAGALQTLMPLESALFVAFALRLAAIIADLLFYLLGLLLARTLQEEEPGSTR